MIRFGIIGRNFVVDWMMAAIAAAEGVEAVGVYSRTPEGARDFAQKYGLPLTFTSIEAMAECEEIDAVYIASPNICHYEQAAALMRHGKHILCEKPAVACCAELSDLYRIAEENHVIFLEAMRTAFDDIPALLREALPQIGPVRRIRFEYGQYSSRYDRFLNGEHMNAFDPSLANAAVMDLGCYAISMIIDLFGAPRSFVSESVRLENGFEAAGSVLMNYGTFLAEAAYGKVYQQGSPSVIDGEKGSIVIDSIAGDNPKITLKIRKGETTEIPYQLKQPNNMIREVEFFRDCVSGKEKPNRFNDLTMETIRIIEAVRNKNAIQMV